MHRYGKIHNLGHKLNNGILSTGRLVVTEKVDGANFRFTRMPTNWIMYGSRRKELGPIDDIDDEPCKKCQRRKVPAVREECTHTFYFAAKWIEDNVDVSELEPGFTYFGEAGIKHTLEYDTLPPFTGFDIWVKATELGFDKFPSEGYEAGSKFISWPSVKRIYERLGIPVVPVLWEGSAQEWIGKSKDIETLIGPSYYGDVKMEGVCLKNYEAVNVFGHQLFAKVKRIEFAEMAKASFGTKPKGMPLALEVAGMYGNEVRIDNAINKLTLEGHGLSMELMKTLFTYVGDDILQEEILSIAQMSRGRELDFKAFYNLVARKCAKRLQERMVDEAV